MERTFCWVHTNSAYVQTNFFSVEMFFWNASTPSLSFRWERPIYLSNPRFVFWPSFRLNSRLACCSPLWSWLSRCQYIRFSLLDFNLVYELIWLKLLHNFSLRILFKTSLWDVSDLCVQQRLNLFLCLSFKKCESCFPESFWVFEIWWVIFLIDIATRLLFIYLYF